MDNHDYKNENLNSFIERGLRLMSITEQLESLKKTSANDEVRALAAAMQNLVKEVSTSIVFK